MTQSMQMPDEKRPFGLFLWQRLPLILLVFGMLCIAYVLAQFRLDLERSLRSYHFAWICVLSTALGCMVFVLIQHATRAGWSVVVRRVFENGMAAMPLIVVLCIPIFYFSPHLFEWMHMPSSEPALLAKAPYLNVEFFHLRALVYFSIWLAIAFLFFRISILQDDGSKKEKTRMLEAISPPAILLYGLSTTFASFDWMMSLEPHWYSTMYGVYFFAGCFLAGIAFSTLMTILLQQVGTLSVVSKEHYQDLGKLLFAFTVFWGYIAFSQFMLYWYANIPEEMEFFAHRLQHGWETITWLLPVTNFAVPFFFLMSRHVKRNRFALGFMCVWILISHFLDVFWLLLPSYVAEHDGGHSSMFTVVDGVALIGLMSLFVAYVMYLLMRYRTFPSGDPRLEESISFENA